jgi:hypothetical protein
VAAGARLFDNNKREAESGEALRLRLGAQTATLASVAIASAAGLEKALKYAAIRIGQNPEEVVVTPNLKFIETAMTADQGKSLVEMWTSGGISKRTMHENLVRGGIASVERTFEEEENLIKTEGKAPEPAPANPAPVPGNSGGGGGTTA